MAQRSTEGDHWERRRLFAHVPALALLLLGLVGLLGLAGCQPGAGTGATTQAATPTPTPPFPTPSRLPPAAALVLGQPYSDFGMTLTISRYDRQVDPATVACMSQQPCVVPGERFIRLDFTLANGLAVAQRVELRFVTVPESDVPGVNIDGPATVLDGIPYNDFAAFERHDQVAPGATVAHLAYDDVSQAPVHAMGVYLCFPVGTPGACLHNTPVLLILPITT